MSHKYPVVPDIGLRVHRTVKTSFKAFDKEWSFLCNNRSAANIAKSCLAYYRVMWDGSMFPSLSRSDIVIDVGAHLGFFSIPISWKVKRVIAYEPAPANFLLLNKNIERNKRMNVMASCMAVGDRDGMTPLYLGVQGTTGHSITSKKRGGKQFMVPEISIQNVIRKFSPTVLKLDCEGAEWLILDRENMPYVETVRVIVAELHKVQQHSLPSLKKSLKEYGFRLQVSSNSWFSKLIAFK